MSTDKLNNYLRQETGSASAFAPFSTACSANHTALCIGSIVPPRLTSPTTTKLYLDKGHIELFALSMLLHPVGKAECVI